jgi:transposase InsO family protein
MCRILSVSKSGYYSWIQCPERKRLKASLNLQQEIRRAYFLAKARYGSVRITKELTRRGINVSRTTVAIHMKKMGLRSKLSKRFKVTTDSCHKEPIAENLLDRKFKVEAPSVAWVSDITYLPVLGGGFTYLTTVLDLFDRKIIGWSISDNMTAEGTALAAFNMAIKNRSPKPGMIFHSDRGVQYASKKMTNVLTSYKIRQSMSRKGNCWDNAVAESFFKTLKVEMIYGNTLISKQQMRTELFEFIEIWYNRKRRHSALNNLNIIEFWELINSKNVNLLNVA